jgi:hypothetical protein
MREGLLLYGEMGEFLLILKKLFLIYSTCVLGPSTNLFILYTVSKYTFLKYKIQREQKSCSISSTVCIGRKGRKNFVTLTEDFKMTSM